MAWYYKVGEREAGPVDKAELQQLVKTKQIGGETLIRSAESDQWRPLKDFVNRKPQTAEPVVPAPVQQDQDFTLFSEDSDGPESNADEAEQPSMAVCNQCGRSFARDQVLTYNEHVICAACKPLFVQKLREGASLPAAEKYAGFWIRVAAKLIDNAIIVVLYMLFIVPLYFYMFMNLRENAENFNIQQFMMLIALIVAATVLVHAAYTIGFVGRFSATLGKMACGLKVVLPGGGKVSYMRATGRFFGEWVTQFTFTIGYIIVAFDDEKRALHDHICGTRVVRK